MLPEGNTYAGAFRNHFSRDGERPGDKDQFELPPRAAIRNHCLVYDIAVQYALRRTGHGGNFKSELLQLYTVMGEQRYRDRRRGRGGLRRACCERRQHEPDNNPQPFQRFAPGC